MYKCMHIIVARIKLSDHKAIKINRLYVEGSTSNDEKVEMFLPFIREAL